MTIEQLYKFEEYLSACTTDILSLNGIQSTPIQRSTGSLVTPRVETQVLMGAPTGKMYPISPTSIMPQAYEGTLIMDVVTDRAKSGQYHAQYVSKCNIHIGNIDNFNQRLPYHYMVSIKTSPVVTGMVPIGNSKDVNSNSTVLDFSRVAFNFQLWIRESGFQAIDGVESTGSLVVLQDIISPEIIVSEGLED